MAASFFLAGFEPWDVTMTDLAEGRIGLESFRGVAFCGGFSYADVLDAGKGWAGVIRFDSRIRKEFESFYAGATPSHWASVMVANSWLFSAGATARDGAEPSPTICVQ